MIALLHQRKPKMGKPRAPLLPMLGWKVQGDLGPYTFYTSRRRNIVYFPKAPPLNPPSSLQITQRAKFTAAGIAWRNQTPAQRRQWELAAQRASLKATGYNLFVHYIATDRAEYIRTISHQTGIQLPPQ